MLLPALIAFSQITAAQMQEDVLFLQKKLPEVHYRFSEIVSPKEWSSRCDKTWAAMPKLGETARRLKIAELVASIKVAHTSADIGNAPFHVLPIRIMALDDGLFIYATTPELRDLAGAKVLEVGRKSDHLVIDRLGGLEPSENFYWRKVNVAGLSGAADAYMAAGLSDSDSRVTFKLRLSSGKIEERSFAGTIDPPKASSVLDQEKLPIYMRRTPQPYDIVADEETKTLILDYRQCRDNPARPMKEVNEQFWKRFSESGYRNVVLDLRRNGGGNSSVVWPFLASLKNHSELAKEKRLFAFISNQTFSSGMMNAVDMRTRGATLIGEPTGGSPNSYGEQKFFELPNSKIRVTYCTKYFQLTKDKKANTVKPDIIAPIRWKEITVGRDACLEAVRALAKRQNRV